MEASAPAQGSAPLLNQKQRRAAQRKERRKRKRQALAQARDCGGSPRPDEEEEEVNDADDDEVERLRLHEEWLEKERLAQEEFRLKAEKEEAARLRKEEEERLIKEEWEAQQRREQEEREQKQQERRGREEAVQKMLDEAESQLENGGPWMNPEAPAAQNPENFGTERDVANCPFFLKTGACRFGDRCSRKHIYPTSSPTLMIRGMFTTFGMEEACRDDYDIDAWVEHTEEDLQEAFLDFYHDVLPELKSVGKVVQFKVSCNYEPHLRGNVYVQFDTDDQCKDAFIRFNGRWYAGRQLHCEICPVTRWKNAICGLFDRQKCPKGKHCNFLHVFRNPSNEFWEADRDLHMSPDRSVRGSRRDGWRSERSDRSWRQRRGSRSPPRSERSQSRRDGDRRRSRSRSRERRGSYQHREDRWSSRSRYSDRRNDWHSRRSRDRSRSRSRSRDREKDRWRDRSKDREDRRRSGTRERERESRDKEADAHRKARERSRSSSREEGNPQEASTRHRHKRSKKSKKKSKKKHRKKKSRLSEGTASSEESEQERESKEEAHADVSPEDQSAQKMNGTELVQTSNEVEESERAGDEKTDAAEAKPEPSTDVEREESVQSAGV